MKLRSTAIAIATILLSASALAQTAPVAGTDFGPASAPAQAAAPVTDKPTLSYALGYQMARDLAESKVDVDVETLIRAIRDGYAKRPPTMQAERLEASLRQFQRDQAAKEKAEFLRVAKENRAKSEVFMLTNKTKTGVVALPSGLQYRIIEAGNGAKPNNASTVTVHLRGSISSGQEFANTYSQNAQPASFKISEFPLAGVREALMMMPVGSRWEVFMSPDQAYGDDPRSPIGPGQAVVFDIKLISVK